MQISNRTSGFFNNVRCISAGMKREHLVNPLLLFPFMFEPVLAVYQSRGIPQLLYRFSQIIGASLSHVKPPIYFVGAQAVRHEQPSCSR